MTYYAVLHQGKCVAKIVVESGSFYVCPFVYDELIEDSENKIPVNNGDEPIYAEDGEVI